MNARAKRFMRQFPTYKDFLVAIHDPDRRRGKDVMEELGEIVGEDDLVDDYFELLRADDIRSGDYVFRKYKQVSTLAA